MKPGTLKIYERTGYFHPPLTKTGIRGYLRFCFAEILPPRGGVFSFLKPLWSIADFLLNIPNAIRLVFFPGYRLPDKFVHEYVEEIPEDVLPLIDKCNESYLNRRGKTELDWIRMYPWVLEKEEDDESRRYYFSSVSKRFFYQQLVVRNETGSPVAFLFLSIRNNHLTVPYAFFQDGMEDAVVRLLYNIMLDYQLNMLTVFHPRLLEPVKRIRSPFLFKKQIEKPYFLPLTLDLPDPLFQDGDGDGVFT
jgi:hypothetical protein